MKNFSTALLVCLTMNSIPTNAAQPLLAPDLVILNATVHTMDTNRPRAEAVAILGNRIAALGSTREMRALVARRFTQSSSNAFK